MPSPTVQLFYNPTAGGHCQRRITALHAGFEGRGARVILSECSPGHAITVSDEASHVCAVGGDGTLRYVASALARCGRALPLSIYPAGTVNLLHRERPFPIDPHGHALRLLGEEAAAFIQPASVNGSLFLACASVGPDSRAVAEVSLKLKARIGKLAYAVAFCRILLDWRREPIRLAWDGGDLVCEAFYVAKGRYFAGPWSFAPAASVAEPLLHVVALTTAGRRDFARFAWALWRRRPMSGVAGVVAFNCLALAAEAEAPLPLQADGDSLGTLPAAFALHETRLALR
jgi:diacylglycerol kinase family enzyme